MSNGDSIDSQVGLVGGEDVDRVFRVHVEVDAIGHVSLIARERIGDYNFELLISKGSVHRNQVQCVEGRKILLHATG